MRRLEIDVPAVIAAYKAGESVQQMSRRLGVSRAVLDRRLAEAGAIGEARQCPTCGRFFGVERSKPQIYCSLSCAKVQPVTDAKCKRCGKDLPRAKPSYRAKRHFCSRACAKAAWSEAISLMTTCEECGVEFRIPPRQANSRRFCSIQCGNRALAKARIVQSLVIVNANRGRRAAKKVLPPKCAICGWSEDTLDSCHIKAVRHGGAPDLDNFLLLCPNHHRLFDRGKIPLEHLEAAILRTHGSPN